LPTAKKKDSQGVCFLGHIDIKDFLSHYVDLKVGDVLDENGEVIGQHNGALVYTLGQRQGFTISTKDSSRGIYYVSAKNLENNTITVSTEKPTLESSSRLVLKDIVIRNKITEREKLMVQTRYRQEPFEVSVVSIGENEIILEAINSTDVVANGQSCVLYRGTLCLGGGIIS